MNKWILIKCLIQFLLKPMQPPTHFISRPDRQVESVVCSGARQAECCAHWPVTCVGRHTETGTREPVTAIPQTNTHHTYSDTVTHIWTLPRLPEVQEITVTIMRTSIALLVTSLALATAGDINRQSIIFNEDTPDVFYCPQV